MPFRDPVALGKAVRNHPALPGCFVSRVAEYARRRALTDRDAPWVDGLTAAFAVHDYRVRDLFREVATSDAFYAPASDPRRESAP